jgi:hypothetical protein
MCCCLTWLYLLQYFFTGTAVILNAIGGHAIMIEMIDAMVSKGVLL